jgi:hypothetical protein
MLGDFVIEKFFLAIRFLPGAGLANTMPFPDKKLGATSHARHESLLASACAVVDV